MRRAAAALLFLTALAAPRPAAAAADPLDAKTAEWAAKGFSVKDRVVRPDGPVLLAATIYTPADASGDRLEIDVILKGKAYLGYSHPSETEWLDFDDTATGKTFADLFKDGSRVIAYRSTIRAINSTSLNVIRFKNFKFQYVGKFPDGRFLEDGEKVLLADRELPLGRYLMVGCEDFGTTSQSAFRTRLYAPVKGRFIDVSAKHPEFYAAEIARKEAAIERLKGDLQKNAGEYLGLTLSLYYDYAARGEARKGWDRQNEFFKVPGFAPPKVKACFQSMRADLRGRLKVPANWP
ncbi:MAG: hypothetical protein KGL74_02965 [Elusimicrobia bacterium]|nr:hypothetical protein [Elusimicrobiota bacterium]